MSLFFGVIWKKLFISSGTLQASTPNASWCRYRNIANQHAAGRTRLTQNSATETEVTRSGKDKKLKRRQTDGRTDRQTDSQIDRGEGGKDGGRKIHALKQPVWLSALHILHSSALLLSIHPRVCPSAWPASQPVSQSVSQSASLPLPSRTENKTNTHTSFPSLTPISSATRAATLMAATRRGCVQAIFIRSLLFLSPQNPCKKQKKFRRHGNHNSHIITAYS